jgi:hypothetical protein
MFIMLCVLEIWLSLMSTLEEAPKQVMSTLEEALKQVWKPLEVMGVFEEVSIVVPLWRSFKHGPHGKTV